MSMQLQGHSCAFLKLKNKGKGTLVFLYTNMNGRPFGPYLNHVLSSFRVGLLPSLWGLGKGGGPLKVGLWGFVCF